MKKMRLIVDKGSVWGCLYTFVVELASYLLRCLDKVLGRLGLDGWRAFLLGVVSRSFNYLKEEKGAVVALGLVPVFLGCVLFCIQRLLG